ncbi:exo-alpha-sialidase, partial [Parabacteroides distasonis]
RIIAPTSIEKGGWRLFFELSDDGGKTWQRTDYVESEKEELAIQPTILVHPDGRLQALARTRNRQVATTFSNDNGKTWSKLQMTDVTNNNSGLDAVTLKDGGFVMICNDWP